MNPPNSDIAETPQSPFERVKQVDEEDNEFWFACDLIPLLELWWLHSLSERKSSSISLPVADVEGNRSDRESGRYRVSCHYVLPLKATSTQPSPDIIG